MLTQFLTQLSPSIRQYIATEEESKAYNAEVGSTLAIEGCEVLEVAPESNARVCTHSGESGKVYADTRVRVPARYRVRLAIPESGKAMSPALENLLNSSAKVMCRYSVTSYFSKCIHMVVVQSRNRDTIESQGLREQDVLLEEVFEYGKEEVPANKEDCDTQMTPIVVATDD